MKKVLFASVPADGHFNPMSRLAVYLKEAGYDIRWYTGEGYRERLKKMDIPYLPFDKAMQVRTNNLDEIFPERKRLKGSAHVKFDIKNFFLDRYIEYYQDVLKIYKNFPFDVLVHDSTFPGYLIKAKLEIPAVAIGVMPLAATSKDLPPYGMGLKPAGSIPGKIRQSFLRLMAKQFIFKESLQQYNQLLASLSLEKENALIFDVAAKRADIYLQNGVKSFDYPRRDLPEKVKYVGHLRPWQDSAKSPATRRNWKELLDNGKKTILVSNGTIEKDNNKLIIPTLEALKEEDYNIIAITAYNETDSLKSRYAQQNIHIFDFVPYGEILPYTSVFVTNGGYGSVLLSLEHGVPMLAAGQNEGKNEICARIDYCKVGIDLRKDDPAPEEIRRGVKTVLKTSIYKEKAKEVQEELLSLDAFAISRKYIEKAISACYKAKPEH